MSERRRFLPLLSGKVARVVLVPLISLLAVGLFIFLAGVIGKTMSRPKGSKVLPALEREFASIQRPVDARARCRPSKSSQMGHALVAATYVSPLGYAALRSHYDDETARRGWSACDERPVYDWFRDLGGMSRSYCKGELRAELQYAGPMAHYGWDFAFSVRWGFD